jgi:hypothetical protein
MKQLPSIKGESLDDAVDRLLAAKARGEHVFLKFKNVNLLSDTVDREQAYIEVYDCTRDRYLNRAACENFVGLEDMKAKSFEMSPRTVIADVEMSRLCGIRDKKTGQIQSNMADEYIGILSNYAEFCKGDKQEEWTENIYELVYLAGSDEASKEEIKHMTTEQREWSLTFYEIVATILKAISDNMPWDQISTIMLKANLDEDGLDSLKEYMMYYSSRGDEFLKNIFGESPVAFKKKLLEKKRRNQ